MTIITCAKNDNKQTKCRDMNSMQSDCIESGDRRLNDCLETADFYGGSFPFMFAKAINDGNDSKELNAQIMLIDIMRTNRSERNRLQRDPSSGYSKGLKLRKLEEQQEGYREEYLLFWNKIEPATCLTSLDMLLDRE